MSTAAGGGGAASVVLPLQPAASEVDGCPEAAASTNDISLVEKLGQKGSTLTTKHPHHRRRRSGSGTKCIWPTTDWLRKLRNQKPRDPKSSEADHQDIELSKRRSSVLLMVLLSSSDEVKAKAVLVSEQSPPSPADEDVEDAIDALWL
ncbi:hypothetical protein KR084_003738 [Drosophila pseudotakahashii]|nr:hypothetical protein KR084_003738 [Drosophila pseudotakahashii]